ncbi:MAG: D-glycero-beta-D-manno-heptose 1,7-bisphosphate 7-phosphatase [Candidatus Margulisiibacteriota bacterium]|nr:D-glycero-beta-D-manno-heptose 1,7-bisphosphate 7-phosphatase [Candidatus Margulisiibacteriota bacterium]
MNKAVFLDRDGTIIEDVGYLNSHRDIQFIAGSIEAIKKLNAAGYKVVVITNQAGVARGLITEDMLQTIDKTLHKWILSGGAHLDGVYYCPHHPEHGVYPYKQECECRKPHSGLIKRAHRELNIDLSQSFMVGDKATDIEAGKRAGTKTILVESGRGKEEKKKMTEKPDHIAENLAAAVDWLLRG